uniref:RING-type E3 ubiquitin transferase n=1 Tax=Terrapene triunguis TaxID=2587831 RepID=A0A674JMX8_9SAUR
MASSNEAFKSDGSFSSIAGTSSEDVPVAAEGSSDSRCPICLERIRNVSYLNPCFHGFCFVCIQEWPAQHAAQGPHAARVGSLCGPRGVSRWAHCAARGG